MSHSLGRWAAMVVKIVCGVIILAATVQTLLIVGPWAETRWFPPVSKLSILTQEDAGEERTAIRAFFTKRRDCEFIGISWFRGDPAGRFERVPVMLLRDPDDTSSPNRPVGAQEAGPWIIGVPTEELGENSFARLYHRCNPLWVTTTDFYP